MPDYRRDQTQGGTYFFTVVTHNRKPILTEPAVRQALREGIQAARKQLPFEIQAWVLLPDHLHCIWKLPGEDSAFSTRWAMIKRYVSKQCREFAPPEEIDRSRCIRNESTIWQRRYWEHRIRNEEDWERHLDYIHWNPVKHGHAATAADWPYSTFRQYVAQGYYPHNWGGTASSQISDTVFGE